MNFSQSNASNQFPVLNHDVTKGEIIKAEDVVYLSIERHSGTAIRDSSWLIGKQARTNIKAWKVLNFNQLQMPLLVKKNDVVEVLYKSSNINIKTKGVALENGSLEKVIKLRNINSNKDFYGTVAFEGVVVAQ